MTNIDDGGCYLYRRHRDQLDEPLSDAEKLRILDLGDDVRAVFTVRQGSDDPVGLVISHRAPDGRECGGGVVFDVPGAEGLSGARWQLVSLDPLHIEPSVLCSCGHHGFIREGRWVSA